MLRNSCSILHCLFPVTEIKHENKHQHLQTHITKSFTVRKRDIELALLLDHTFSKATFLFSRPTYKWIYEYCTLTHFEGWWTSESQRSYLGWFRVQVGFRCLHWEQTPSQLAASPRRTASGKQAQTEYIPGFKKAIISIISLTMKL